MAYADQSMSGTRVTALIIVALIHIVVGYALVTGLAYEAAKKVIQKVTTVDIKEEVKKEEVPPPPKKADLPPPPICAATWRAKGSTSPVAMTLRMPRRCRSAIASPAPGRAWSAMAKSAAILLLAGQPLQQQEGRVGVRVTIGRDGRVASGSVSSPSGTSSLDNAACDGMTRYARFEPALDDAGNPTSGSFSTSIVYKLN